MQWTAIVPVKRLSLAKTRLHIPGIARDDLALAFALDTVAALCTSRLIDRVVIVTDDRRAREALDAIYGHHTDRAAAPRRAPVSVVPDVPNAGLNTALEHGARTARTLDPRCSVVAVSADLPALKVADLDAALEAATEFAGPSFVADLSGVGTTMLFAPADELLVPDFGPRSRAAHRSAGATELVNIARSARRDVDTAVDLWDAARLGLGPATTALTASEAHAPDSGAATMRMQATVESWDARTGATVALDTGLRLRCPPESVNAGGWRSLRSGQRVALVIDGDPTRGGTVTQVRPWAETMNEPAP